MDELLEKVEPLILTVPAISYTGLSSQVSQSGKFDSTGNPITKRGSPYLSRGNLACGQQSLSVRLEA